VSESTWKLRWVLSETHGKDASNLERNKLLLPLENKINMSNRHLEWEWGSDQEERDVSVRRGCKHDWWPKRVSNWTNLISSLCLLEREEDGFLDFFFLLCTLPIVSLKTRNGETSIMLSCTFQKYYSLDLLHNIYTLETHHKISMYSFRTTTPYYRHLCLSLNKNHITKLCLISKFTLFLT